MFYIGLRRRFVTNFRDAICESDNGSVYRYVKKRGKTYLGVAFKNGSQFSSDPIFTGMELPNFFITLGDKEIKATVIVESKAISIQYCIHHGGTPRIPIRTSFIVIFESTLDDFDVTKFISDIQDFIGFYYYPDRYKPVYFL